MYDNTKLKQAMKNWLAKCCTEGWGEESANNLLISFEEHCKSTGDMKRSPGRVVFGQQLRALGFDRRKLAGIAHWSGLALIIPPEKAKPPRQYKKTTEVLLKRATDLHNASQADAEQAVKDHIEKMRKFKKNIARETSKSARAVGGELD